MKALYREYTDATFSMLKNHTEDHLHHGFLGPVIRAVVGDRVRVVFKNNAHHLNRSLSIHPHGLVYTKQNEGVLPYENSLTNTPSATHAGDTHAPTQTTTAPSHTDMHPTGGAHMQTDGGAVPYGETYTYTWEVPERSGPGPKDGSSVVWIYHSGVDEMRDINSGLVSVTVSACVVVCFCVVVRFSVSVIMRVRM